MSKEEKGKTKETKGPEQFTRQEKDLFDFAEKGNLQGLRNLVREGININLIDRKDGHSALTIAALENDTEMVEFLIKNKADVNQITQRSKSAIEFAAEHNNLRMVQILIDAKADNGFAIASAISNNNLEMVKVLIENKADVNQVNIDGESLLMLAVREGNVEIVETLIENEADVNHTNIYNESALMLAAFAGHAEVVETLIENGANVNQISVKGESALINAILQNNLEIVETLVKNGANVNQVDNEDNSALIFAVSENNFDIAKFLIKSRADVNQINSENESALMWAKEDELITELLKAGAKIDPEYDYELSDDVAGIFKYILSSKFLLLSELQSVTKTPGKELEYQTNILNIIADFIKKVEEDGFIEYLPSIFNNAELTKLALDNENINLLKFLKGFDLLDSSYVTPQIINAIDNEDIQNLIRDEIENRELERKKDEKQKITEFKEMAEILNDQKVAVDVRDNIIKEFIDLEPREFQTSSAIEYLRRTAKKISPMNKKKDQKREFGLDEDENENLKKEEKKHPDKKQKRAENKAKWQASKQIVMLNGDYKLPNILVIDEEQEQEQKNSKPGKSVGKPKTNQSKTNHNLYEK